jgi:hypothetical protein
VPTLAVVLGAVVVLGALVATGVIPLHGASSAPAYAPTFQGAASEGQGAANSYPGGPWGAAAGVAARLALPLTEPASDVSQYLPDLESVSGCNVTLNPELPKDVVVDATPSAAGPGASAFWVVLYVNESGGAVAVIVDGGNAIALFTLHGTGTCRTDLDALAPFPSGSPDSPAIIDAANASGGSAFLSAHPGATQIFGGASAIVIEPTWVVVYTTCAIPSVGSAAGYEFNATVTGTTVETNQTASVNCSALSGLSLGASRGGAPDGSLAAPLGAASGAVGKAI